MLLSKKKAVILNPCFAINIFKTLTMNILVIRFRQMGDDLYITAGQRVGERENYREYHREPPRLNACGAIDGAS